MTHRVLVPQRFLERLSAEARTDLERLQAGLAAVIGPPRDFVEPVDEWQRRADVAAWYLRLHAEETAPDVSIDADLCEHHLLVAAEHGYRPSAVGVTTIQAEWLATARWPRFADDEDPPLLRGG